MVKVKAQTNDLVVVDLEADNEQGVRLDQGEAFPSVIRIFKNHIEIDMKLDSAVDGQIRKKTRKFYYHDLLLMNETLYRIQHPQ